MLALLMATTATAQEKTEITEFNLAGPFAVSQPFAVDTVKVDGTTGQTDGDASLKNYTVTFKARKALAKFDEFYDAL